MLTPKQARRYVEQLLQAVTLMAMEQFEETVAPVHRVAIKVNPAVRGLFLVMVVLCDGQRYEGRLSDGTRRVDWCLTPNCNCQGFARTRSPLELGATIDD